MILWVVLFVLVVAISFVLAARSMRDFAEVPAAVGDYSLFLIRKPQGLTLEILSSIRSELLKSNFIISFERLFKGKQSALVVFGPKKILVSYQGSLDLLELEDYTNVDVNNISAWEVGIKENGNSPSGARIENGKLFSSLPHFLETEQFWWQLVISSDFKIQIRALIVAADNVKRNNLTQLLQNIAPDRLFKLPKAFSNAQILNFYKLRSLGKDSKNPQLNSEEILNNCFFP